MLFLDSFFDELKFEISWSFIPKNASLFTQLGSEINVLFFILLYFKLLFAMSSGVTNTFLATIDRGEPTSDSILWCVLGYVCWWKCLNENYFFSFSAFRFRHVYGFIITLKGFYCITRYILSITEKRLHFSEPVCNYYL